MPFTLTDDPYLHGLEISLSNILMIGLFRSNKRMVIFSKTKIHTNDVHMELGWSHVVGVLKFVTGLQILLKICHMSAEFVTRRGRGRSQNWSFFVAVINV